MERAARGNGKVSYVEDSSDSDDDLLDSDMEDAAERTTSRLRLKSNSTVVCNGSDDSSLILGAEEDRILEERLLSRCRGGHISSENEEDGEDNGEDDNDNDKVNTYIRTYIHDLR